ALESCWMPIELGVAGADSHGRHDNIYPGVSRATECAHVAIPTDRRLRVHWRLPRLRARESDRVDRLVLPPTLRRGLDLQSYSRRGAWRILRDHTARAIQVPTALSQRHDGAADG